MHSFLDASKWSLNPHRVHGQRRYWGVMLVASIKTTAELICPIKPTLYQSLRQVTRTPGMTVILDNVVTYSTLSASVSLLSTAGYKIVKPAMSETKGSLERKEKRRRLRGQVGLLVMWGLILMRKAIRYKAKSCLVTPRSGT